MQPAPTGGWQPPPRQQTSARFRRSRMLRPDRTPFQGTLTATGDGGRAWPRGGLTWVFCSSWFWFQSCSLTAYSDEMNPSGTDWRDYEPFVLKRIESPLGD